MTKFHHFLLELVYHSCGDIGLRSPTVGLNFGPGVSSEDGRLPEEETSLLEETELVNGG